MYVRTVKKTYRIANVKRWQDKILAKSFSTCVFGREDFGELSKSSNTFYRIDNFTTGKL